MWQVFKCLVELLAWLGFFVVVVKMKMARTWKKDWRLPSECHGNRILLGCQCAGCRSISLPSCNVVATNITFQNSRTFP